MKTASELEQKPKKEPEPLRQICMLPCPVNTCCPKTALIERRMKAVKRLGVSKIGAKKKLEGEEIDGKKKFGDPKPSTPTSWWTKLTEAVKNFIWGPQC